VPHPKVLHPNFIRLLILLTLLACAPVAPVEAQRRDATAAGGVVAVLGIPEETELLAAQLKRPRPVKVEGLDFTLGELRGQRVVLARVGFGKVNAALAATLLREHFQPQALVFTGNAGALNPSYVQGDVVVGTLTTHHDFGMVTPGGFEHWRTRNPITNEKNPLYFPAEERLLRAARAAAKLVKLARIDPNAGAREPAVLEGVIVTGDQFIADPAKSRSLRESFKADAVEMEGASVAQVCWQFRMPCLVVRSVSDRADGGAIIEYDKFVKLAAANSSLFVSELVFQLGRIPRPAAPAAQEWKSAFELAFGEGSPYAAKFPSLYELPYDVNLSITKEVLDRVVSIALAETGARRLSLAYLPGGFQEFPVVPSAQLDTRSTEAQTRVALDVIGYLAQQSLVIASRREFFGNRAALQITQAAGSDLSSPANAQKFWRSLSGLEPKLKPGFAGTLASGRPGLFIIDTDDDWLTFDEEKFDAAAAAASQEQNVKTSGEHFRVEYVSAGNDWKQHPKGEQYLKRLSDAGRRALALKVERVYRPRVERWIAEAFARRGLGAAAQPLTAIEPSARPSPPPTRPTARNRAQMIP
jgi:adenosylhomocysteine nucleosidase